PYLFSFCLALKMCVPSIVLHHRVKPASRASKPSLKRVPQPIKSFLAKQESKKRVDVHHRNLNKLNRVDSSLNFKPTGFVSDSIAVCKMCDECLFAFNHDKCVVRYLNSVNAKPSSAKHVSIPTKQVWRARGKVETSVRQEWKPTGRTLNSSIDTPMVERPKLDEDLGGKPIDPTRYRGMVGSLMYLSASRPDIVFAVCMCARYQARPTDKHHQAIKRIFKYLKGTINMGLSIPLRHIFLGVLQVAQGHTQEEGIDYDEVFSPVARIEAIRLFLAYASFMGFTVYQMDVKSAFLYGTIDEEVYVMQPPGFQDLAYQTKVYKVEKLCMDYIRIPEPGMLCREFEAFMYEKFQMSAMGELNFFLGLQVLQKEDGCSKHIIGDRSRLMNFMKKFIWTVRFENDHFGAIVCYGDYVIGDSVISRVYYVEGLGHNLFYVRQFCDSDLKVAFRKHSCYVCDTDGIELIKGSRGSNLYTISVEDIIKSSPICLLSKVSKNKSWLWHQRLNHLNFGTINDLARKDLVRGLPRLKFKKDHLY
nr:copia protein [Tanacetum cinerariifolium]